MSPTSQAHQMDKAIKGADGHTSAVVFRALAVVRTGGGAVLAAAAAVAAAAVAAASQLAESATAYGSLESVVRCVHGYNLGAIRSNRRGGGAKRGLDVSNAHW